jgi:L-iditol 2-dehydrogenase
MPKSDPSDMIDLNLIHYSELHIHGANSSVYRDYIDAKEMIMSKKEEFSKLVTHEFNLTDFNKAVDIQGNPANKALKVIIVP